MPVLAQPHLTMPSRAAPYQASPCLANPSRTTPHRAMPDRAQLRPAGPCRAVPLRAQPCGLAIRLTNRAYPTEPHRGSNAPGPALPHRAPPYLPYRSSPRHASTRQAQPFLAWPGRVRSSTHRVRTAEAPLPSRAIPCRTPARPAPPRPTIPSRASSGLAIPSATMPRLSLPRRTRPSLAGPRRDKPRHTAPDLARLRLAHASHA
jgi:hypothetical protein